MASIRSAILDAVYAAVNAGGKPAGVTVYRTRDAALADAQLPAIVLTRVQEDVVRGDGPRGYKVRRTLRVQVDCYTATATDGETSEDALDPITSWVVQAVMADPTLGGLAHNSNELATSWTLEDRNSVHAHAAVVFGLEYITAAGNPDA
jgi:hypothetical protein